MAIYLHAGIIKIIIGTLHKIIITVPQMKQTIKEEQYTEEECMVGAYSIYPFRSTSTIVLVPLNSLLSSYINYRYNTHTENERVDHHVDVLRPHEC